LLISSVSFSVVVSIMPVFHPRELLDD